MRPPTPDIAATVAARLQVRLDLQFERSRAWLAGRMGKLGTALVNSTTARATPGGGLPALPDRLARRRAGWLALETMRL